MHSSRRKKSGFFVTCGDYGGWISMLCYAMLCYAILCYAMLCYAMLCYTMLCYAMLCYAMHVHRLLRTIDDIVKCLDVGRRS